MAQPAFVAQIGTYSTTVSQSAHTVSITTAPSVGNHLILKTVIAGGRNLNSVTDSAGNTWQVDRNQQNTTNHSIAIASAKIANALTTTSTLVLTFSAANVVAAIVEEYSGLDTTSWFEQAVSAAAVSNATIASGATSTTTVADSLLQGVFGDGTRTITPETLSPAWVQGSTVSSGGTVRNLISLRRIVTATGTYAFNGTMSGSSIHTDMIAVYKGAAGGSSFALAGTAAATATATGALTVSPALAGAIAATATLAGNLGIAHSLAGSAAATATLAGNLGISYSLAGSAAATATLVGSVGISYPLAGTAAATATLAGDLTFTAGGSSFALAGGVAAGATLAGDIGIAYGLAGVIAAAATLAGDLTVAHLSVVGDAVITFPDYETATLTFADAMTARTDFLPTYTAVLATVALEYDLNDTWSPTVTFKVSGAVTDPTTVTMTVIPPDKAPLTYTYAGGTVTKSSTGVYTKDITLSQRGVWYVRFEGTGTCQASADGTITVRA